MVFTVAEKIQILRKRSGLNQGNLGSKAFNTTYESGRTKIKNLELGKQKPTQSDLENIARVLGVGVTEFLVEQGASNAEKRGLTLHPKILALFPGLGDYFEMLNKAVVVDDKELIDYIAGKLADALSRRNSMGSYGAQASGS